MHGQRNVKKEDDAKLFASLSGRSPPPPENGTEVVNIEQETVWPQVSFSTIWRRENLAFAANLAVLPRFSNP